MRNRSKNPPNWNIWNPPWSKSISYSSIYDKRREFQRLIRKMKIEGPNTCGMSSCSIFDYTMSSPSKTQKKIDAIIFDESENFNCLLLQMVLDEQFLRRKSNSLMVFLNKSRNCKIFELHSSCIYISCKEGFKWPVFYYLFEFLIQKPSKTIIGVKFYTHFVCKSLIANELTFSLIHSSKHDALKLAVQYKKCQSEEVIDSKSTKISSAGDLKDLSSYKRNLPLKKKVSVDCKDLSKSKQIVIKGCKCKETKWQHFKPVLKCARRDYMHILEAKGIFIRSTLNCSFNYDTNIADKTFKKVMPSESSTKTSEVDSAKGASLKRKLPEEYAEKDMDCTKEKLKSPKLSNAEQVEQKLDQTLRNLSTDLNHDLKNGLKEVKDTSIVVLSEKNIPKISETGEIPLKRKISVGCTEKTNSLISTKENYPIKIKQGFGTTELKTDETKNSFMNFKSTFSSISNIHGNKLETPSKPFNNQSEIPTFQTASGKSLIISDKARQIAEKIYTEVCSQSTESDKQEEIKNFSTIDSRKEFSDDELDTFFQDVCNETDIQCSSSSTQGNITLQYQQGKSKKSLGGRRSLKPYSHNA